MKPIKYITITLFALVGVLWGLLLSGCKEKVIKYDTPVAGHSDSYLEFMELSDSFDVNDRKVFEYVSKGNRDSALYYHGRSDVFYELETKAKNKK